jgi:hypothetical protein
MTVLFSLGLPSRFTDWCDGLVASLAERALGGIVPVNANTAEEVAAAFIASEGRHFLVRSRQPAYWLRRVLSGHRFVLAVEDPRAAVAHVVAAAPLDWAQAIRIVGCGSASLVQCSVQPGALVVHAQMAVADLSATAKAISTHLGLALDDEDIAAVVDNSLVDEPPLYSGPDDLGELPDSARAAADGALLAYAQRFAGEPLSPIVWARDLFWSDCHAPATRAIDITGASRFLIYGPYISIPAGYWTAEVLLGFTGEAVDYNFIVDVFAGPYGQLTSASIQPPRQGVFPITLNFEISETNDALLEIRVMNQRAAFDGKLALMSAVLKLQQDVPTTELEDWTREFGRMANQPA